ncbi:MAG: tRNA 2-selenouridine(34) synthase MnmH [Cellvibrionaceae bacterium]
MATLDDCSDYHRIFLGDIPLLDVRAPIEFKRGAFPSAVNLPLLDDDQRRAVGTEYKAKGQDAAIEMGWKIATPSVVKQRLDAWQTHIKSNPQGYLYCFRGGLRSKLSQQILTSNGVDYPIVSGGYKTMRRYLIDNLESVSKTMPLVVLGGRTGSGKTDLLGSLSSHLDLEGRANHRGSAFGDLLNPQPTQIDFENAVSIDLLKLTQQQPREVVLEDEGKLIGRLHLPLNLRNAMRASPLVVLDAPLGERISRIVDDYILSNYAQRLTQTEPNLALAEMANAIQSNLLKIRKRLGGALHHKVSSSFNFAIREFARTNSADFFRPGIQLLLTEYYDPMYLYQLSQRQAQLLFRGDAREVTEWLQQRQTH